MTDHTKIPTARTLSIQPTQQCTAACAQCGTFSSPAVKVRLPTGWAEDAIRQAARAGFREVSFSGGEPTLTGEWLTRAIELASSLGLKSRVVTNGWWAKSVAVARRKVRSFVAAGLRNVTFSTGDQHARFISVDTLVNAVEVSVTEGLCVAIVVELVEPRRVTKASLEATPTMQSLRATYPRDQLRVYESPWMPLDPLSVERYPAGVAVNAGNLARRPGCDDILHTITIAPDGLIGACCGIGMRLVPELQLGNIAQVPLEQATARADSDPLKHRIRVEGPEHLLAEAATRDPGIHWENMYAHRCQACIRMYTDPAVRRALLESQR